jgi:PPOX class probable F420-dependent enzyme
VDAGIRSFLERARRAHLATASRAGEPHVVPICFAVLDDDVVVFAIDDKPKDRARSLKRLRNLAENDRFALVVDVWDEDWTKLAYVLLHGSGSPLPPGERRERAVGSLRARYSQYVAMGLDASREVIELRVERVHAWGAIASTE